MASYALVLSCEHGGNIIPPAYVHIFKGHEDVLQSHRGWDAGTLKLAQSLAEKLDIPLVSCTVSRLLIEMNRSLDSPTLFSEFSSALDAKEKSQLIETLYLPYRSKVASLLKTGLNHGNACLHFSIHSFTPIFDGIVRETDIGILFDPARALEVAICFQMKALLNHSLPEMEVTYNAPYKGTDDGLTTFLRTQYPQDKYAGIEIEINQKWVNTDKMDLILSVLENVLSNFKKKKASD